jgi:hypothetical protein
MKNNINFYYTCRHILKISVVEITNELKLLFDEHQLPNLAETLNIISTLSKLTDETKSTYLKFDQNEDFKLYSMLKFSIKPTSDSKMLQFYALCRYQLNETPNNIVTELSKIFDNNTKISLTTLNCWIINNWIDMIPVDSLVIKPLNEISKHENFLLKNTKNETNFLQEKIKYLIAECVTLRNEKEEALKFSNDYVNSLIDNQKVKLNESIETVDLKRLEFDLIKTKNEKISVENELNKLKFHTDQQDLVIQKLSEENLKLISSKKADSSEEHLMKKLKNKKFLLKSRLNKVLDLFTKKKTDYDNLKNDFISMKNTEQVNYTIKVKKLHSLIFDVNDETDNGILDFDEYLTHITKKINELKSNHQNAKNTEVSIKQDVDFDVVDLTSDNEEMVYIFTPQVIVSFMYYKLILNLICSIIFKVNMNTTEIKKSVF